VTTPDQDSEHLRLLSIFHYVAGGIQALFACIPIIHVVMGIVMMANPNLFNNGRPSPNSPPAWIGLMFVVIGGTIILLGWTMAVLSFLTARSIGNRRRHLLCLVTSGINCLWMPFGTVLGVFTIIVLTRPAVKASFN
jgi:hypothetical protein